MTTDLQTREAIGQIHSTLGHLLNIDQPTPTTRLLGRHLTVFQIPSASTPNFYYLVAGTKKDGWVCTCIGHQSNKSCRHVQAVRAVTDGTAQTSIDQRNHRSAELSLPNVAAAAAAKSRARRAKTNLPARKRRERGDRTPASHKSKSKSKASR